MKKIFSFFAAILFAGSMMATTYSVTFDQNNSGNNNIHITTTTANSSQTGTYEGVTWTVAWTGEGVPTSGNKSQLQVGTGSKLCNSLTVSTSDISGTITSVKVTTWGARSTAATCGVSVGSTAFKNSGNTSVSLNNTEDSEYEFTGSASGAIVISWAQSTAKAIYLKKVEVTYSTDPDAIAKPTISGEENFLTSTTVTISHDNADAIYYTIDGTDPTTSSTLYSAPFALNATATVKAIAVKGSKQSAVASKEFTKTPSLTTMDEIYAAATAAGSTATDKYITFNNWVVTGVKNSNAYVTDGTKGFIVYASSHGFEVGDILSGTVSCKVQLYNKAAEVTALTASTTGLTVTDGGVVTPVELDADGIDALSGVNTGSVIKISGECTVSSTNYFVAGVQVYNKLYDFAALEEGKSYTVTGVYLQFNTTKEMFPRSAADIEESTPTAISNAEVAEKAVKFIENGQMFIIKNGVKYNAQGAVVK